MPAINFPEKSSRGAVVLTVALAAAAAVGCGTTLISEDVTRQGDGWTIVLQRLTDGPNSFQPSGYTLYHPVRGERFIYAWIKVRNDAPFPRVFGYDACDLDLDGNRIMPGMVSRYNGIMSVMDRNETYPPGDVSYRILIYSYPEGRMPTRLKCAYATFDFPKPPPH